MKKWFALLLFAVIGQTALAQDLIVKRNAEEIKAKILLVSATEVEYRKANNPEGPIYKIPIADIFYIKYENGTKDVFSETPAQNPKLVTASGSVQQEAAAGEQSGQQNYEYRGGNNQSEYGAGQQIVRRPRFTHPQERYPHYQGEVALAYGLGVGLASKAINTDRAMLETVHGVRLCPYFFLGAGMAFNYFYNVGDSIQELLPSYNIDDEVDGASYIPVFLNTKGYYPISRKCSLYFSLDLGTSIPGGGLAKGDPINFYTTIGPGINFGNGKSHSRCDFSIRFQHMGTGLNAILFRIGLGF